MLVDSVTDYAIYMLDPTGKVTTWNSGAQRMKGYRADEIVGRSFEVFFPEEARQAGKPKLELEIARREGHFTEEGWRVRKDGTRFWANVVVSAIYAENGEHRGFAKVTRDLTAQRAAEETERNLLVAEAARAAAERLAEQAAEANRVKDEFLATVSHELRTPLNAIVGWTKLLLQRSLDPAVARGIAVIDRNADAQAQLIDDILDVSRIITGKLRIDLHPMDLRTVTKDAIDVVRPSADAKQIKLDLALECQDCLLIGDPTRLRQVAWNLLSNAVKFTAKGGSITVTIRNWDSRIVLIVSDTGRGIGPDFLPYVFDRFKQEEASTTRRIGGLGLGLALVRHIVELHGGTVEVVSELGKGSTFTVSLPVRAVVSTTEGPVSSERHKNVSSMAGILAGLCILIVDDEPDARELVRVVLESADAQVETAASANEAIEILTRLKPHIVISDIAMPEQDGYALMRHIREQVGLRVPTIALTAHTRAEDQTKALAAGFTTHVGKPVNPDDLIRAVKNLVAVMHH
jgi:PAS domain S-box-containing protein